MESSCAHAPKTGAAAIRLTIANVPVMNVVFILLIRLAVYLINYPTFSSVDAGRAIASYKASSGLISFIRHNTVRMSKYTMDNTL